MDYTISFFTAEGKLKDERIFENVPITASTRITTDSSQGDATVLQIDKDGDGIVDSRKTAANHLSSLTPGVPGIPNVPSRPSGGSTSTPNGIAVSTTVGGAITAAPSSAAKGATVTLTAAPDEGYELESIAATSADGKKIALQNVGGNKYTFTMPDGKVSVTAQFGLAWENPFTDVKKDAWYYDAVKFANQNAMMNGIGGGMFCPDGLLTRAQLAQILYNKEGKPAVAGDSAFTDIDEGQWYSDAVAWAEKSGVVAGYDDGRFGPSDNITREQLVTMLWRYAGKPSANLESLAFADAAQASGYARDALLWAVDQGILNGKGEGVLDPGGSATRAEAAQVLMQFVRNI